MRRRRDPRPDPPPGRPVWSGMLWCWLSQDEADAFQAGKQDQRAKASRNDNPGRTSQTRRLWRLGFYFGRYR